LSKLVALLFYQPMLHGTVIADFATKPAGYGHGLPFIYGMWILVVRDFVDDKLLEGIRKQLLQPQAIDYAVHALMTALGLSAAQVRRASTRSNANYRCRQQEWRLPAPD
jgi:hypothetical protein